MSQNQLVRFQWTDDTGTGTDGTIINNTQLQRIFDAVDAALGLSVRVQGANYTVLPVDDLLKITGGSFTVSLYTAVGYDGRQMDIVNVGTGVCGVDGFGAQTVGGLPVWTLPPNHALRIKSDGANWIIVGFSVAGVALEGIWVPVTAFRPLQTGGSAWPETIVYSGGYDLVSSAFDPVTQESMSMQFVFPNAWDRGSLRFTPYWTNVVGGAAANVQWALSGAAIGHNEPLPSLGTPGYITQPIGAAWWLTSTGISQPLVLAGSVARADLARLVFARNPLDAADTYGSDAHFLGLILWYSVNARSDD